VPLPQPAPESTWEFPEPFGRQDVVQLPFSEVAVIAGHLRVAHLRCFINKDPVREAVDRILGGAFAPGELFDADDVLRALAAGVTFEPARCLASGVAS
jgi:hypothetical protein